MLNATAPTPSATYGVLSERSWLAGVFIGTLAFGVQIPLFFLAIRTIWQRKVNAALWTLYTASLFALNGVGCAAQLVTCQLAFIDNRYFVGGPVAYISQSENVFVSLLGNVLVVVSVWYQDGLLIFYTWALHSGLFGRPQLGVYLSVLFLAEMGLGCVIIKVLSSPGMNLWTPLTARLLIAYFSFSLTMNFGMSIKTSAKLVYERHSMRHHLSKAKLQIYDSLVLSLMSGSLLYSVSAIIFLAAHGSATPVPNLILPTISLLQSIIPLINIITTDTSEDWEDYDDEPISFPERASPKPSVIELANVSNTPKVDIVEPMRDDSHLRPSIVDGTSHGNTDERVHLSDLEGVIVRRS